MSDNDLYLQYVDEIVEQLNQKKQKQEMIFKNILTI